MTTRVDTSGPSSPKIRSAIVIAGKARGMSLDDIRALTPKGSVSMLTAREAAQLLSRLNSGTAYDKPAPPRQRRRPNGIVAIPTGWLLSKDSAMCRELRAQYGWSEQQLTDWLTKRTLPSGASAARPATGRDYQERIELIKGVLTRARKAAAKKEESPCPF